MARGATGLGVDAGRVGGAARPRARAARANRAVAPSGGSDGVGLHRTRGGSRRRGRARTHPARVAIARLRGRPRPPRPTRAPRRSRSPTSPRSISRSRRRLAGAGPSRPSRPRSSPGQSPSGGCSGSRGWDRGRRRRGERPRHGRGSRTGLRGRWSRRRHPPPSSSHDSRPAHSHRVGARQGRPRVLLQVDSAGRVRSADVVVSSGDRSYDEQLRRIALGWRFRPARDAANRPVPLPPRGVGHVLSTAPSHRA